MPIKIDSLIDIINKNKDKKMLASKIIETNPKTVSILPKLIANKNIGSNIENNTNISRHSFESIYNKIKSNKQNNKNIIKLFPDIELAIQILVSSILSPKNMTDIQLNYKLNKNINIDTNLASSLLEEIKTYINKEYELEDKLPEILRESLFNSGAYVYAVIPESSVDDIINTDLLASYSTEEFKSRTEYFIETISKPINILNIENKDNISLEGNITKDKFINYITSDSVIRITDNINILKFNKIKDSITKSVISSSLKKGVSISTESLDKLNYLDIFRQKKSNITNSNLVTIKTKNEGSRRSIGKPMVIRIPTESTIPVFIPGNESQHIGYFILLDDNGKPLSTELTRNDINNINSNIFSPNIPNPASPIQKAYTNLVNSNTTNININELFDLYKDTLEKQIYNSIKNSLYGSNIEISNKNDIYFLMFSRALSDQKTNILYIPKELIVYFCFYYSEIGTGESLLDNISILSSLRAILLFSKIMAHAKQSIDVTKVNISLDPNDPDPEKTIEQVQDSVLKLRQNYFPLGINNPIDLVNWIQRAGLQFSYDNNPLLPNIKIDFENANLTHTIPNSDLEEELRKQTIIALGLSPETVDNGFSPEFATTVVHNNILLSKRIAIYQKKLCKHLTSLVNILLYNDEELRSNIRNILIKNSELLDKEIINKNNNYIEELINNITDSIYIDLPKPESTNIVNLSTEYDAYKENLEKVIDSIISSEIFTDQTSGNITSSIDTIKNIYKHYLLRKWMTENNYYPEALELVNINKDEINDIISLISSHNNNTGNNIINLLEEMKKIKEHLDEKLDKINGEHQTTVNTEES